MRLTGLFVYPIKSCAGVALQSADVVARGLADDRRYLLVDRNGTFITQRTVPELCLVKVALAGEHLQVSAGAHSTLTLPRALPPHPSHEARAYQVWDDHGHAWQHAEGSRWFSELLRDDVSLLYMPDSERRAVNPSRARPGDIVSFADAYPLLLISEASLADLNQRLEQPVEMRRFRPNLVISGCDAYAEDGFAELSIAGLSFRGVKRCERCVVTTVDPDTAEQGKEPLRTLAGYRQSDGKVWFGMNLIHDACGTLRLGDEVVVHVRL